MKIDLLWDETLQIDWRIERMKNERNALLAACDWTQTADAPVDKTAWAVYRQALRDFPATWEPGAVADFPNPPDWVEAPASDDDAGEPSFDAG